MIVLYPSRPKSCHIFGGMQKNVCIIPCFLFISLSFRRNCNMFALQQCWHLSCHITCDGVWRGLVHNPYLLSFWWVDLTRHHNAYLLSLVERTWQDTTSCLSATSQPSTRNQSPLPLILVYAHCTLPLITHDHDKENRITIPSVHEHRHSFFFYF